MKLSPRFTRDEFNRSKHAEQQIRVLPWHLSQWMRSTTDVAISVNLFLNSRISSPKNRRSVNPRKVK